MQREEYLKRVSDCFYEKTGIRILERDIHDDGLFGLLYYIPPNSLEDNSPLVIHHRMGIEFIMFPYQDVYKIYENPEDYIINANWNAGYYWGYNYKKDENSLLEGIHWEPVPLNKVYEYFEIIRNQERGAFVKDDRFDLCDRISNILYKRYGLIAKDFFCTDKSEKNCIIYPNPRENMRVDVNIPTHILIKMLYHPKTVDIDKVLKNMSFEFGIEFKDIKPKIDRNPIKYWEKFAPNKVKNWII